MFLQKYWLGSSSKQDSSVFWHASWMGDPQDMFRTLHMSIHGLPKDWRRHPGCPSHTWLRTLEADLRPLNHGLNSAWRLTRIKNNGGSLWKWLCCSQGFACNDDDDEKEVLLSQQLLTTHLSTFLMVNPPLQLVLNCILCLECLVMTR